MADIRLNVTGDASSGTAAMDATSASLGKSVVAWTAVADAAKAASKAVVDYVVESVKKYAESERVQRQLIRATGDYADALSDQAEALSKLYAVDDDIIKQSQVLLTQWGGVGAASREVTEAAINLAAALGGDVNTATADLIRNVESGGVGLGKLGIHFKVTGDKGKDLAAAVAAINSKLGGAGAAEASSLTGSVHAAQLAFDDLQKSIGGMFATIISNSGVLGGVTEGLRTMTLGTKALAAAFNDLPGFLAEAIKGKGFATQALLKEANKGIAALMEKPELPGLGDVSGKTNKGLKDAANDKAKTMAELNDASLEAAKKYYADLDTIESTAQAREEQSFADSLAAEGKHVHDSIQLRLDGQKAYDEIRVSEEKKAAEHNEKMAQDALKAREKSAKESADAAKKSEREWQSAGDQIGAAFVNALGDQLAKLAAGEEFDAALFVGDILASVISIAATVIGTAYGQPALGAAVGNLAAMGVRAGAAAISASNKKSGIGKKHHQGGWATDDGLPRYHDGTWVGGDEQAAILQNGERVLSKQEVSRMGGPRGVDAAAKGGMGINVSVMAIDAKNAAESFVGNLGLGLKRALRTGQGDIPRLLGVSPR